MAVDTAPTDRARWERLLEEQTGMFAATMDRNAMLEGRVEELQRELNVWKVAMAAAEKEAKAAKDQVNMLQRQVGSLTDDHPLILVLIDGDGNIFTPELLALGNAGGARAATLLTRGIMNNLDEELGSRRVDIWVTLFLNKKGLSETLTANDVCTPEQFDAFIQGFNQSAPLYSIVDVGQGKEAADSKLKESLRTFARWPQTAKVFFGGAHDNGYSASLKYLEHEGLLSKVVFLKGYYEVAQELKGLDIPVADIDGLFMRRKMTFKKPTLQSAVSTPELLPQRPARIVPVTPSKTRILKHEPISLAPFTALNKLNPPPCNMYYLSTCLQGSDCRYGHHYKLTAEQIETVRRNAKKSPCGAVNRGQTCPQGEQCTMGHVCPRGRTCIYLRAGKCKFIGKDMHDCEPEYLRGNRGGHESADQMYQGDGESDEIVLNFDSMGEELASIGI